MLEGAGVLDASAGLMDVMAVRIDPIDAGAIFRRPKLPKEADISPRAITAMVETKKDAQANVSMMDLPDEALLCLFDALSPARGKRTLVGRRSGGYFEEEPGARSLSQAHPRFRRLFEQAYLRAVTIDRPFLPPDTFFDELFGNEGPRMFDTQRISRLHLKRAFCLESALSMATAASTSAADLPVLPGVKELRVSRPLALSELFFDALTASFPSVEKFWFAQGRYGVMRFDKFLAEIVSTWGDSLTVLNLSGVHGARSNLEYCIAKVTECSRLEDLDLSKWEYRHFASSSLRQTDITPLRTLTGLKRLSLRHCKVSEHSFTRVMQSLSELRELDVLDSSLGPNVATMVPPSITILRAGSQYLEGDYFTAASSGPSFFIASKLPNLRTLEWGHWPEQEQGWDVFLPLAGQIDDLRLHGPDYQSSGARVLSEMKRLKVLCLRSCLPNHAAAYTDVLRNLQAIEVDCFFDYESVPGVLEFHQRRGLAEGRVRTFVLRVARDRHAIIDETVASLRKEYPSVDVIVDEESDDYVPYLNEDADDDLLRHKPDGSLLSSGVELADVAGDVEFDDDHAYYF